MIILSGSRNLGTHSGSLKYAFQISSLPSIFDQRNATYIIHTWLFMTIYIYTYNIYIPRYFKNRFFSRNVFIYIMALYKCIFTFMT